MRKQRNEPMMLYKLKMRKEKGMIKSSNYSRDVRCKNRRREKPSEDNENLVKRTKLF